MITGMDFLIDALAGTILGLTWYFGIEYKFKPYHKRWFFIRFLGKRGKAHEAAEYIYCHYLRKN